MEMAALLTIYCEDESTRRLKLTTAIYFDEKGRRRSKGKVDEILRKVAFDLGGERASFILQELN
jgi:hypothetical protein